MVYKRKKWMVGRPKTKREDNGWKVVIGQKPGSCGESWLPTSLRDMAHKRRFEL